MVKRRPVIVLVAHKSNSRLVSVVPLSTTGPNRARPHHYQLRQNPQANEPGRVAWAKCDMVAVVSTMRLGTQNPGAPKGALCR